MSNVDKNIETKYREIFKDHKATLQVTEDGTQIVTWKRDGSVEYSMEFIFRKHHLYVSGDLWDAVFHCTWEPKWNDNWQNIYPDYFAEKCTASEFEKKFWDAETGMRWLKEDFDNEFQLYIGRDSETKEQFEQVFDLIKEDTENIYSILHGPTEDFMKKLPVKGISYYDWDYLNCLWMALHGLHVSENHYEYKNWLNSIDEWDASYFDSLDEADYGIAYRLSEFFDIYLVALTMIKEQLTENLK